MAKNNSQCPYCREMVAEGAHRCKHCLSDIKLLARADHGGVCPLCRERVNPEATMCKHCKQWIGATTELRFQSLASGSAGCGCGGGKSGSGGSAGVGVSLGIAGGGMAMMLRRPGFGNFGGFGATNDGTNVDCACVRDCVIKDGKTTCGPWECTGPPGCLDLPK
jgi:hypothetical protein